MNVLVEFCVGIDYMVYVMVVGVVFVLVVIVKMKEIGFDLLYVYGLIEVYGLVIVCVK